jgi:MFS family permease
VSDAPPPAADPLDGGDGRLVGLVGAILFLDSAFYSALIPILGRLSSEVHLSAREAGLLVGAYAGGMVVSAYPCSRAVARWGARNTVLGGLVGMAVACLLFALGATLTELLIGRVLQGVAGALTWTGGLAWLAGHTERDRRGRVLGAALGTGVFGTQAGPALGVVSVGIGRLPTFAAGAVVCAGMLLAAARSGPAAAPGHRGSPRGLLNLEFAAGMWLTFAPSVGLGVVDVLASLRLNGLGVPALLIGVVFFAASGLMAIASRVTGIAIDRMGVRVPALVAAAGSSVCLVLLALGVSPLALGVLVAVSSALLGSLWGPSMALLADATRQRGVDDGYAFGGFLFAWAVGFAAGAGLSGLIASAAGGGAPYLLSAAFCVVTAAVALGANKDRGASLAAAELRA